MDKEPDWLDTFVAYHWLPAMMGLVGAVVILSWLWGW